MKIAHNIRHPVKWARDAFRIRQEPLSRQELDLKHPSSPANRRKFHMADAVEAARRTWKTKKGQVIAGGLALTIMVAGTKKFFSSMKVNTQRRAAARMEQYQRNHIFQPADWAIVVESEALRGSIKKKKLENLHPAAVNMLIEATAHAFSTNRPSAEQIGRATQAIQHHVPANPRLEVQGEYRTGQAYLAVERFMKSRAANADPEVEKTIHEFLRE
ncbi:MAG: hypothetical protein HY544_05380 [Candidatus Diapherotrites archaeon]|uniref:Uncharacterized protein n=1 Tax=Candidatus Iainarchaeum sp. TaxID=3101447 RepID=A0A8T3YKY7_9ARCH|nr:hypothetical protein [Candidatus Diapherotrites archaeon]